MRPRGEGEEDGHGSEVTISHFRHRKPPKEPLTQLLSSSAFSTSLSRPMISPTTFLGAASSRLVAAMQSMSLKSWIEGDESAKQMLARVLAERPLLLLPPLHRVPLRVGNVVEIVGPSPSAKSQILLQAAVNCILPKEFNGIHYGGLERLVMYIDLDCRFDILRLSQLLKHHIIMGYDYDVDSSEGDDCLMMKSEQITTSRENASGGSEVNVADTIVNMESNATSKSYAQSAEIVVHEDESDGGGADTNDCSSSRRSGLEQHENNRAPLMAQATDFNEELFRTCMRRFLYIRCYSSMEFLAALKADQHIFTFKKRLEKKTMQNRFQKETAAHGVDIHFLMIDSIGAFYWVDRASKPLALEGDNRRYLSLQSVAEAVVQEIRKILQLQPMLVLATKTNIYGMGAITSDTKRTFRKWTSQDTLDLRTSSRGMEEHIYREYMPLVWQSFVTHRILLRVSDENFAEGEHQKLPIYIAEWVLPSLNYSDKFTVKDAGIFMVA
ncbi:DNA repair protein XRCC2 isoform X1 [Cinnamomum micranthum f. kanehirae]|uniref:DNA repair protein XRCC2 isoform X1 n=1 Tax=Cinnamomum micranthum f. kanehirae TaxID=337451 RepID=A0A443P3Y5_9MAGN|nr:DNA repair protein XRCC2 isoform X1 [Cinnamomum micranthum f. kanehirae]